MRNKSVKNGSLNKSRDVTVTAEPNMTVMELHKKAYMDSNTVKKDEEIEKISTTSGDVVFELKKGFFTTQ